MTVAEALSSSGIDPREARLLLAAASGLPESALVAFPEKKISGEAQKQYLAFVARRAGGEPIAYILGRKEFYGLELAVNAAVLIPRPETELLVDLALARRPGSVLDLGTGSGAIALALKRHLPSARVVGADASAEALALARQNAAKFGLDIEWRLGRWFEPLAGERFEGIVCNPPYVAVGDPHLAALPFEPRLALLAGGDGLDAVRIVVREAPAYLLPGGWLLLEHGEGQQEAVRELLEAAGLETHAGWPDLAGIPRVAGGRR